MKKFIPLFFLLTAFCTQKSSDQLNSETSCFSSTDTVSSIIDLGKRMVLVPSGTFLMGDSSSKSTPVHEVQIQGFYMDETPVTYADFLKFVDAGGNKTRYWDYSSYNIPEQPITGISWYHAVNYCNWRSVQDRLTPAYQKADNKDTWGMNIWELNPQADGYRLPTEAQWEYAARGGLNQKDFPWGNEFDDSWANYDTDKGHKQSEWWRLALVKTQKQNGYGLYGMAGNIWEWTNDWYGESYYETSSDCNPTGPKSGRSKVTRGGGWGSPNPDYLKVHYRSYAAPSNYNYSIGFRCIRPINAVSKEQGFSDRDFYKYPISPVKPVDIANVDFYSDDFITKLGEYLGDNFPQCLYFLQDVDGQDKITPKELARLIVEESEKAKINPLFVTSIMISESGFATVSFPRWWNNPMAYHWQNKNMVKGLPTYDATKASNRKYKDLRAAIQNYSRIRREIYYERAQKDLYSFHILYVGYEAEEWMYTIGKVFREVANIHISPTEPATNVGTYIYSDWE